MEEWGICLKNPFGTLCVQGCCRIYLPCRRSRSASVTALAGSFPYVLGAAWTTEAFVSQHIFADQLVGRRRGRNTSSTAVLPLGKEGSSVWWHRPQGTRTCCGFPLLTSPLWKEGPRLVTAPMVINASLSASACLFPLPQDTVRLLPWKKITRFQLLFSLNIAGVIWQPGESRDRSLLAVSVQPPCAEHGGSY